MLQNPRKTLGFKKNMVFKIPPGGGGKPYPASGLLSLLKTNCLKINGIKSILSKSRKGLNSRKGIGDSNRRKRMIFFI